MAHLIIVVYVFFFLPDRMNERMDKRMSVLQKGHIHIGWSLV